MKKKHCRFSAYVAFVLLGVASLGMAQAGSEQSAAPTPDATANAAKPATPEATANVANPAAPLLGKAPEFQTHDQRYQVLPGDVFDITFDLSPEFNQAAVAVQPDGFVTLRGVGDVKVEGQTVPQLRETIRMAYSHILHDPIISLTLKDFQKPFFIADGQLGHPGKYEIHGPVTLTEAIAIAGGFLESAKHSQVLLYRRFNDQWLEARLFNIKKMQKDGKLTEDPYLHPGDMVFVPKNRLSKIRPFIPNSNVGVSAFATPI